MEAWRPSFHVQSFSCTRFFTAPCLKRRVSGNNQTSTHRPSTKCRRCSWIKNCKVLYEQIGNRLQHSLLNKAGKLQNSTSMYTVGVKKNEYELASFAVTVGLDTQGIEMLAALGRETERLGQCWERFFWCTLLYLLQFGPTTYFLNIQYPDFEKCQW